ncbi:MAG: sugar ABC transporter permease [Gemmiger sp.]|uniref:carbohydrate ABC transporter permease n=1 Tax=Gemmiger sp. TaxID=2049027 RepID=UPI002A911273|nr:sugar ABC transporter permease [Gemmiger sp.]MDY5325682.1 sugar ABC transporter permease [Gemmiger sp.]
MEKAIKKYWPVFVLPTLIAFLIGFIWPFIWGVGLSFCKFTTVKNVEFVGLSNYINLWKDATFLHAFGFTVVFTIVSTVLINCLAFLLAVLLTRHLKGTNIFRTVFFMPNLIGGVVLGYIWQILFNGVLSALSKPLLSLNATYGFWGIVILMCWQQIGYMMIIYIAGLQAVPGDMLEAAEIDGASGSQTLFRVIIPNVMPSITTCTFLTLTNSFKLFDQNLALTGGLPSIIQNGAKFNQTELLALNIYSTYNINKNWHGVAQAKAVIFFILVAVLAIAQQAATRRKEVQQ